MWRDSERPRIMGLCRSLSGPMWKRYQYRVRPAFLPPSWCNAELHKVEFVPHYLLVQPHLSLYPVPTLFVTTLCIPNPLRLHQTLTWRPSRRRALCRWRMSVSPTSRYLLLSRMLILDLSSDHYVPETGRRQSVNLNKNITARYVDNPLNISPGC